jgi:RimJ/RimL family protein N-acetyltransferase
MKRTDLDEMIQWRRFADPLYQPFDFPRQSRSEHLRWFEWRGKDPRRRLYTIENEAQQIVGSLTLREIDGNRSARLGITIGADFVSQGYGTEALRLFLGSYFGELGFVRMVLDVAATNLRAVRAYFALGFRRTGHHYRPANHSSYRIIRRDPRYHHLRRFFDHQGGSYRVLFYDMAITREEWFAAREEEAAAEGMPDSEKVEAGRQTPSNAPRDRS